MSERNTARRTVEQRYSRPWVGLKRDGGREVFKSLLSPTPKSHGEKYVGCIGPFRTVRGAAWMADPIRGTHNPHCRFAADAERLGEKYKAEYDEKSQTWKPLPIS